MAGSLNISPGQLDSLVGLSVPLTDYTGLAIQSFTTSSADLLTGTLTSLNATDTGLPGPGAATGETVSVVAVSDAQNTITLGIGSGGTTTQLTEDVIGYSSDGILLSLDSSNVIAVNLNSPLNDTSTVADILGVLSGAPISQGTTLAFTATGNTSIGTPTPTPPSTPTPTSTPPWLSPAGITNNFSVSDQSTTGSYAGGSWQSGGTAYSGPVAGLTSELIAVTSDNINVTATTPNTFISLDGGSGEDAISVAKVNGNNVLNGSTGSSFLYGGTGNDTFFVDDRNPPAGSSIWSTVVGFHSGDNATVWGVTPNDFNLSWVDGQGASGFTGLTLHATAAGEPTASLTLTGLTSADLSNGALTVTYGTTAAVGGVPGSNYMLIHHN